MIEGLVLQLLAGTQAAALASLGWVGRGDRASADQAAVGAMRDAYRRLPVAAEVVVGEGAKDKAPMLHLGERLGSGGAPIVELAVDPLEGTAFCASGREGAISVVACAPAGALWRSPDAYYMDKVIVGANAAGAVDLDAPVAANLLAVARASGKRVTDVVAVVLAKPRHTQLIADVRAAGARVQEISDGDIAGALSVVLPNASADILLGVGGAPEGVITACAVRLLGGHMLARLSPQTAEESARLREHGVDVDEVLTVGRLAGDHDCVVAATGVTGGLLARPTAVRCGWRTQSLLLTSRHAPLLVTADHPGAGDVRTS